MLGPWRRKSALNAKARELYGSIVAQARHETFYRALGVPDTPEGRLEMILLHLVLAAGRLRAEGPEGQALAQAVNEVFVVDFDDNMRELGISDLGVPRRVKKAAAGLYDRHREILAALAQPADAALEAILASYTADLRDAARLDIPALARYVRRAARGLESQSGGRVLQGTLDFPAAV